MAKASPIQTSFNGGIFSPLLDGHIDGPRRDTAYQDSNNLIPLKQGPLVRRGGTQHVFEAIRMQTGGRTKLIPFYFNDEQTYILEWGNSYMRVYKDNGVVLIDADTETITGISATDPAEVTVADTTGYSGGNWVVLTGLSEATHLNDVVFRIKNVTATTFELYDTDFTTTIDNTVVSGGVAETSSTGQVDNSYFLALPYDEDDMFDSDGQFIPDIIQSNDVMYVAQGDYVPQVLTRTDHDAWTISDLVFNNGPYLPMNDTDVTMAVVLNAGRVWDVTASSATFDANDSTGGSGTGDMDRLIRFNFGDRNTDTHTVDEAPRSRQWHWGRITSYTSPTVVQVTVDDDQKNFFNVPRTNPDEWQLGAYSTATGFPSVVELHEGRIVFGVTSSEPRRIDFSSAGGFNPTDVDFTPSDKRLSVRPDDGMSLTVGGNNQSPVQWISSIQEGLAIGSTRDEGIIRSSSNNEGLSPLNATYRQATTVGSASIQALKIGHRLLFVQKAKRRLHELTYSLADDNLISPDMTELAEHLTREKIIDIVYQQQPIETVWVILSDGNLLGFTYERNSDVLGWHRHTIGGTDVDVHSAAVIPAPAGTTDELWLAVERTISGKTATPSRTYLEYTTPFYDDSMAREAIIHQDGGITSYATEIVITGATAADPVVITTSTSHGLSDGDIVYIKDVVGMTEINMRKFVVDDKTATTFELTYDGADIDGSGYTAYDSGGTVQLCVQSVTALDFLEGETLEAYVDGNSHGNVVVTSGAITLNNSQWGANISLGFPTDWMWESFPVEGGSQTGASQGKTKKLQKPTVKLWSTLGFKYGVEGGTADTLVEESFLYGGNLNAQTPLYTGWLKMDWPVGHVENAVIYFEGDGPFPVQIQALIPHLDVEDRVLGGSLT